MTDGMESFLEILHKFSFAGLIALFLFEAVVLLVRGKSNKARRTMAYLMLLWVAIYLLTLIRMHSHSMSFPLFRADVAVIGNIYIPSMLFFPMQVLVPGWLNWKRFITLLSPIVLVSGLYYVGLLLLGEHPEEIYTYRQLGESFWHFNVWYRFVILLSNLVYMFLALRWLYRQEKRYIQWKNENFADQDYVDISWMRSYDVLMAGISLFYLLTLAIGGRFVVILHTYMSIIAFSYLFYKALFHESPYPEDFFAIKDAEEFERESEKIFIMGNPKGMSDEDTLSESSFERKLPGYVALFRSWMEEEKPYLYGDFQLTNVTRVLPLNRSYLSRLFNEGFGCNFSEVVRRYRVDYAKGMIEKEPTMALHQVGKVSGFLSDSTFVRAFKLVTGLTPNQYRQQLREHVRS